MGRKFRGTFWWIVFLISAAPLILLIYILNWLDENRIQSTRSESASHILLVGLDSRPGYSNGVPDSLILIDLSTGEINQIPRNLERLNSTGPTVVEKYLGVSNCEPFCSFSGLYSIAQVESDLGQADKKARAADALRVAVESEFDLKSLAIALYDLNWAFSFLNNVSPLKIEVSNPIPIGGFDAGDTYEGVERYIPSGIRDLQGEELFWFARARFGSSNEDRMLRQVALVEALWRENSKFSLVAAAVRARGHIESDLTLLDLPELFYFQPHRTK